MDIYPEIVGQITDWDIIVIGHLKVNTFFGETYDNPQRGDPSTCTSVMVRGITRDSRPYVLIVDPTLRITQEDYYFDINRRTGLRAGDVTHCFCTHHHGDHYEALRYFPGAVWYAETGVADMIKNGGCAFDISRLTGVVGEFLPGVYAVPLPGHTGNLHGVAFQHRGRRILVAGDAVMTKYHFDAGVTDFQNDPIMTAKAAQTIQDIKESYDIVVPGHDNMVIATPPHHPEHRA